jgi:16S rRNA (uracil1498-N3)-methyltransferase
VGRLFVKGLLSVGMTVTPSPNEAHYLARVLRLGTGDRVLVVDEGGREFTAGLTTRARGGVVLEITAELPPRPEQSLSIHLFVGLLKGKKMEEVVKDAAQAGAVSLVPFSSSRTIPQEIGGERLVRMKKIAEEESRLARRNRPLAVHAPLPFSEALGARQGFSLILWEDETRGIGEVLKGQEDRPAAVSIFTGPEGGFSEAEVRLAQDAGLIAAGLGCRIFRAQTAPLVAAAIVQYEWGDL